MKVIHQGKKPFKKIDMRTGLQIPEPMGSLSSNPLLFNNQNVTPLS